MEIRKMIIDGVFYNVLTDDELDDFIKEIEFKKELDMQHERLMNGETETMSIEDFAKKRRARYGL
ncbi:hypothetical protein [Catenibacterium sp.]|uniref:hypothetical protein n=1 Tax=Catenibacterium sp. TaxID=2049022 RepID=UPI002E7A44EF|nr:hypothetical protein [Catenibacterium sp.]MEE0490863.1 hypothetical protein [Catenibacterium sp.]